MSTSFKKGSQSDYFGDDGGEYLSEEEEEEECEHSYVSESGFCEECGMKMEVSENTFKSDVEFSEFHSKATEVVTYDEVFSLTLPQEVKDKSMALLNSKGTFSSRDLIHKQEIFIAVMLTFIKLISDGKEFEIPYDESLLLKELGLKLKHRTQISNLLSGLSKNSLPIAQDANVQIVIIPPTHYIPRDCKFNKIPELSEKIKAFAKKIIDCDRLGYILQDNPKHMSLAFIKIYLENIKKKACNKFSKANSISEGILKTKIETILSIIEKYDALKDILKKN